MSGDAGSVRLAVELHEPCVEEKRYALSVMLSIVLGCECEWRREAGPGDSVVTFPRGYRIRFRDSFFSAVGDSYASAGHLPGVPLRTAHPLAPEGEIVAFFGNGSIEEGDGRTVVGPDVVASAFFLLSRWEEAAIAARDRWGRVPDDEIYVRKQSLDGRPLVNEYASWIARSAELRDEHLPAKPTAFELVPTHDLDRLYFRTAGEMLARASAYRMPKRLATWSLYRLLRVDQAATIGRIMDLSEAAGLRARFYCMAGGAYPLDLYYLPTDPPLRRILREVEERGHLVCFHPSSVAASDAGAWRDEKKALEDCMGTPTVEARQHYLKVELPRSLRIWADNGIKVDSSLGFSRKNGFRCGTGCAYPLFDLEKRTVSEVWERPLLVMDAAVRKGDSRAADKAAALGLVATCERYRMPCTILFHNHALDPVPWNDLGPLYEEIMAGEIRRRTCG